jgi:hypothetical protein
MPVAFVSRVVDATLASHELTILLGWSGSANPPNRGRFRGPTVIRNLATAGTFSSTIADIQELALVRRL